MDGSEYIERDLASVLARAARSYPVVTVTGPRQSGKTTLCRQTFRDKPWVSLEAIDNREFAISNPRGFLAQHRNGAILDEIQRAPDLLSYLQTEVDENPEPGRFILTGSENLTLSEKVSQSLAGRSRMLQLLPPSYVELQRFPSPPRDLWETLWMGAYPRIHQKPTVGEPPRAQEWLGDYISAYIERDVRQVSQVINLEAFRKLLVLAAGRTGQVLNRAELGADAGVTQPTARAWLSVLETSFVCHSLPAWHRNVRKQQVKSPKLHFFDTGLVCALLGIRSPEQLRVHHLRGALFETWVASEVLKARLNRGLPLKDVYHYRESQGAELDLVVMSDDLFLVEAKVSQTVVNEFFRHVRHLASAIEDSESMPPPRAILVYGGDQAQRRTDVTVVPWRELHTIPWAGTDEDALEPASPSRDEGEDDRQRLLSALLPQFAPGGRFHGRYEADDGGLQLLPRTSAAWQLPVFPMAASSAYLLRLYELGHEHDELRAMHWRNEARALHQLASSSHPAIPRLYEAGRVALGHTTLGYVVLGDAGEPIVPGHPLLDEWRDRPGKAFAAFVALAEAVALLHEEGLLHRALTPEATRAPRDVDAAIVLDDFQLSGFVATWLRRGVTASVANEPAASSPLAVACLAPERLSAALGMQRVQEGFASDVFSLGMIGLGWLVEPFARWPVNDIVVAGAYDEPRHRALLSVLEERAHASALPPLLRNLLLAMIAPDSAARPASAREVHEDLCRMYGSVLAHLDLEAHGGVAMQLYYLVESVGRLHSDGRTRTPSSRPDHAEYARVITKDLADGVLTWAQLGPVPWVHERDPERIERMKSARIALLGEHYAYFCQYLHHGRPDEDRRVLVIKYMVTAHQAKALRNQSRQRPIPSVEPRMFDPKARVQRPVAANAPSWKSYVDSTQLDERHEEVAPLVLAGRWLRSVQLAAFSLQEYAVERVEAEGRPALRQIEPKERSNDGDETKEAPSEAAAFEQLRLSLYKRQSMGELFEELHERALEEDREQAFELRTARQRRYAERLHFEQRVDARTVVLKERGDLPARGFLRPDDLGGRRLLGRQALALEAVEQRHPFIAAQLTAPSAVELLPDGRCDLGHLDAPTVELVRRILSSWPLFVLQGPPGTGKTYVARQVVRAVLQMDPFARILVAAQSHHALDNLLEGVVGELDDNSIALRIASVHTEHRVGERAQQHMLTAVTRRVTVDLQRATIAHEAAPVAAIATHWREHEQVDVDVMQRIPRAASVVFSTCAAATSSALAVDGGRAFDWVIVEEAARAWITELLMPMLHGTRWLLIGDHRQLPPFEAPQIRRLLARDATDHITAEATGIATDREWDRFLAPFESIMAAPPAELGVDPRHTLKVQRRMHPDIGTMVSRTFYDGMLETHPDAERLHGISVPAFVAGTALVWVDTSAYGSLAHERRAARGGYVNEHEASVVARLLEQLELDYTRFDPRIPPLAVLSPYRAQLEAIRGKVSARHREAIDTTDAFQGREAEIVVVSLVRSSPRSSTRTSIGFLAEPERVNVLLSRARRLLVIVGDLETFARVEDPHWRTIVDYVRGDPRFRADAAATLGVPEPAKRSQSRRRRKKS
jgi:predicted AAA+ superfamily ATPase